MSKGDIITGCIVLGFICLSVYNYLAVIETEKKFQKTIDMQNELVYNKEKQIAELEKTVLKQEEKLVAVYEELKNYREIEENAMDIRVTHYSADETGSSMTASGREAVVGRTVACNFLPMGTHVIINGHEYIVEDTGGMTGNVVDIFVNSVDEANTLGTYHTTMRILQ